MTHMVFELDPGMTVMAGKAAGYKNAVASIHQIVTHGLNTGASGYSYHFPYMPVEVEFEKVGADYQEIERPGNYSFVSRRAPTLLKASFEFRVAHRPSNGLQSVEHDLEILRRLASEDEPIVVVGFGAYFNGVRAQPSPEEVSVLFRITDLNVKVVRRGLHNEPWQADCKIDLIEDRNPIVPLTAISSISYAEVPTTLTTNTKSTGNKGTKPKKDDPEPNKDYTELIVPVSDSDR